MSYVSMAIMNKHNSTAFFLFLGDQKLLLLRIQEQNKGLLLETICSLQQQRDIKYTRKPCRLPIFAARTSGMCWWT